MFVRGLLLLVVLVAGIFAGMRELLKSGDEQTPGSGCGPAKVCTTTAQALPGGWPRPAP